MIELNYPIDAVRRVATIPHISWHYKVLKRGFDFSLAAICLALLWPDKVRINLNYQQNWSLRRDISYIIQALLK